MTLRRLRDPARGRRGGPVLAMALLSGSTAFADEPVVLDKVEVVGSRIARIDAETGLPVQIIRREDILRSGVQTTEELLAKVSANVNPWTDARNIGSDDNPGFSGASLRSLGSATTLILLNGRRLANYAFTASATGVDLHAIPLAAIERVEILKDGASAIYGSDAIAGVINVVLRNDFRGVELTAFAGDSQAGGGSQTRGTVTLGFGDPGRDGYNVFAVLDHQKGGELPSRDRPFSATSYRPQDGLDRTTSSNSPGNIPISSTRFKSPAAPGCNDTSVFKKGACYYDYAPQTDDLAPTEQTSVLARGSLRLAADHEAFAELLYETHTALYKISATPISNSATNGIVQIDVPTTSPYYPQGLGLTGDITDVRYRTVSLGPRTSQSRSDNERALVGMKGSLAGWDYDTAIAVAASHAKKSYVSGYVDSVAVQNAFASGLVDPFGDSGPVGNALLASTQVSGLGRTATGITRTIDGHASKDVAQLPAGPLAMAIGGEWRRETLDDIEEMNALDIAGGNYSPPKSGSRDVQALFVEFDVPILHGLDAQIAGRRDHYSDFGNSWNPKAALRWQPVKSLLLRASAGKGFRAPSLPELYTARASAITPLTVTGGDVARCPVTQLDSDCDPVVPVGYGGNPQLQPVRSTQAGLGIVFEPTPNWNASIDYWRIRLNDNIGALTTDTIFANPSAYEDKNILRGPVDPAFPTLPGPIVGVDTYNQNLGRTQTSGFDLSAGYRADASSWGRFSARLDGTLVTQWTQQLDGVNAISSLGAYVNGAAIPRWRHQLSLGWERGPAVVTLGQSFQTGYTDEELLPDGSTRHVASYTLWDLQFAYAATKDVSLRCGVRNLFDRDPPFTNQDGAFQAGYDPSYADPRGRFWYVTASVRFR